MEEPFPLTPLTKGYTTILLIGGWKVWRVLSGAGQFVTCFLPMAVHKELAMNKDRHKQICRFTTLLERLLHLGLTAMCIKLLKTHIYKNTDFSKENDVDKETVHSPSPSGGIYPKTSNGFLKSWVALNPAYKHPMLFLILVMNFPLSIGQSSNNK